LVGVDEKAKLKPPPPPDDDDDLEEVPVAKTYKEEGTPAVFSSRTSLSGLTFTDDEDGGKRDTLKVGNRVARLGESPPFGEKRVKLTLGQLLMHGYL
jgi:hypothetical protein